MLLLNSIEPERWYTVREVARVSGWARDTVIRRIKSGQIKAVVLVGSSNRRVRSYRSRRIQGCEIIRWLRSMMTN